MDTRTINYATGSILPLGDGLTGKSVLTRLLLNPNVSSTEHADILYNTKKSLNIELEFASEKVLVGKELITTSLQFYVFPGQRQKETINITTFDEILNIFHYFPAMQKINVLLLVYDVSRSNTLKSLEIWLKIALARGWIYERTLIVLVSNKIDLQEPDIEYLWQLLDGIYNLIYEKGVVLDEYQIRAINTSCFTMEGILLLRETITDWVAENGLKGVGSI
jgi:GTPase SAR1 family protein